MTPASIAATTRGVTLAALMAALARPEWWLLALASFLVRGGIALFLVAVVTLPSPLALSNFLAPIITPIYLGRMDASAATLIAVMVGAALAWFLGGTWIAAATEVVLIRDARATAVDEGLPVGARVDAGPLLITRAAAAHLVALVPLAVAVAVVWAPIYAVVYRELINPSDPGPIVFRVFAGAAVPLAIVLAIWVLCELVGGAAVRRVVLLRESVLGAVARAAVDLVRRPVGALIAPVVTLVVLILDLTAVLLVVAIVWRDLRDRLVDPLADPVATALTLVTFAGAWCLALAVTGLVAAWRSVAMSFETDRAAAVRTTNPSSISASASLA
jgi:hypothetical protein